MRHPNSGARASILLGGQLIRWVLVLGIVSIATGRTTSGTLVLIPELASDRSESIEVTAAAFRSTNAGVDSGSLFGDVLIFRPSNQAFRRRGLSTISRV